MRPSARLALTASKVLRQPTSASSSSASSSNNALSRPQDAISGPERSLLGFPDSSPSQPIPRQTPSRTFNRSQELTASEAEVFRILLDRVLPPHQPKTDKSILAPVRQRVGEKIDRSRMKRVHKAASRAERERALSKEEEERLEEVKESMDYAGSDYELLRLGLKEVFGVEAHRDSKGKLSSTILPDLTAFSTPSPSTSSLPAGSLPLRGPTSRLFPHLLPHIFDRLSSSSPTLASHIFHLATLSPESYVRGCTPTLYAALLRLRWREQADIEGILSLLQEMRASGVRVDSDTQRLIEEIGQAIRTDEQRAENVAQSSGASGESVDKYKYFSSRQVSAWAQMEEVLQDVVRDKNAARDAKRAVERAEYEHRMEATRERYPSEVEQAQWASPSLFRGGLRDGAHHVPSQVRRHEEKPELSAEELEVMEKMEAERKERKRKEAERRMVSGAREIWGKGFE